MLDFNIRKYGYLQLIVCIMLNTIGLIFIRSTAKDNLNIFITQLFISIFSIIVCIFISFLNLKKFLTKPIIFFIISIILLLLVKIIGTASGRNSIRWIQLPGTSFQIQPSEFAKIFMILYLSKYIEKADNNISSPFTLFKIVALFFIPFILVLTQPNLSSSIIIAIIFVGMIFSSKIKTVWIFSTVGIIFVIFTTMFLSVRFNFINNIPILRDYQKQRIISFFNPDENSESQFQQENSIIAIGSGKLYGKGINNDSPNSVKNGNWLVEEQNDFIFAVVGEEIGFVGSMVVVILYIFLVVSCVIISAMQTEYYKKLICIGVATWLAFQTFVNIGVALSIIPNTGVPLPFFSQGGSSLLAIYIGMGFVLNCKREYKREGLR